MRNSKKAKLYPLMFLAVLCALGCALLTACAGKSVTDAADANADAASADEAAASVNGTVSDPDILDTFAFELDEGEDGGYADQIEIPAETDLNYTASWTPSGLPLDLTLLDSDGTAVYSQTIEGGSVVSTIEDVPAGSYRLTVRNGNKKEDCPSLDSMVVTGAIGFGYAVPAE